MFVCPSVCDTMHADHVTRGCLCQVLYDLAHAHGAPIDGVRLTTLSDKQADYLGVAVEGPYKADAYRY